MTVDVGAWLLCGVPVLLFFAAFAIAKLFSRRQHRARMETYRAACRELGLTQTEAFWEGSFDGRWIGTSWVRLAIRVGKRRPYPFTRSVSRALEPLGIGLYAYSGSSQTLRGTQPAVESWRRELPPRVALDPDPFGGKLRVHAQNPDAARARLARGPVVELLRAALTQCDYVRLTDEQVELIHAPYVDTSRALGDKLQLAARIVYALE